MICTATPYMLTALRRIWKICFADSDTYLDFIFARLIRSENILVHLDQRERPAAMLCLQQAALEIQCGKSTTANAKGTSTQLPARQNLPCAYIYGVATLPESRGQGMASALLQAAHERLKREGVAAAVLAPSDEKLFNFYHKHGYEDFFSCNMTRISSGQIETMSSHAPACVLRPVKLRELAQFRRQYFGDSSALLTLPNEFMGCIDDECALSGGEVLGFNFTERANQARQQSDLTSQAKPLDGYAVCHRHNSAILVKEYAGPDGQTLDAVLAALHQYFNAEEYLLYLRADKAASFSGQRTPFGMLRRLGHIEALDAITAASLPPPYLAHALD